MSKTDNTRPVELQFEDETKLGYVDHCCTKRRGRAFRHAGFYRVELECSYKRGNILEAYRSGEKFRWPDCSRQTIHYGGQNYIGGAHRGERKQRRRKIRARERAALKRALQMRGSKVYEFDLLPIREDANTIVWDIT